MYSFSDVTTKEDKWNATYGKIKVSAYFGKVFKYKVKVLDEL